MIHGSGSIPSSKKPDTDRERCSKAGEGSHKQEEGLFWVRSPLFGDKRVFLGGLSSFGGFRGHT